MAPYGFANPYFYCFQAIIVPLAYSQFENGQDVPIDFIFDDQQGLGEEAKFSTAISEEDNLRQSKGSYQWSPSSETTKTYSLFRLPTCFAWHVRRSHEHDSTMFWVTDSLSYDGIHMAVDIGPEQLRRMADAMAKIPGSPKLRDRSAWKKTRKYMVKQENAGIVPSMRLEQWRNTLLYAYRHVRRYLQAMRH